MVKNGAPSAGGDNFNVVTFGNSHVSRTNAGTTNFAAPANLGANFGAAQTNSGRTRNAQVGSRRQRYSEGRSSASADPVLPPKESDGESQFVETLQQLIPCQFRHLLDLLESNPFEAGRRLVEICQQSLLHTSVGRCCKEVPMLLNNPNCAARYFLPLILKEQHASLQKESSLDLYLVINGCKIGGNREYYEISLKNPLLNSSVSSPSLLELEDENGNRFLALLRDRSGNCVLTSTKLDVGIQLRVLHCQSLVTCNRVLAAFAKILNRGRTPPIYSHVHSNNFANLEQSSLNTEQHSAVCSTLVNQLTLLNGPPGCGKTRVLLSALSEMGKGQSKLALVTAPSHKAVQRIVADFAKSDTGNWNPVYMVSGNQADNFSCRFNLAEQRDLALKDMQDYVDTLETLSDGSLSRKDRQIAIDRRKDLEARAESNILRRSNLVFCTVAHCGSKAFNDMFGGCCFDLLAIDEAGQLTEPEAYIALSLDYKRVLIAGDYKQLQPTVLDRDCSDLGLGRSLLERLVRCGFPVVSLNVQYRMHPEISLQPSSAFYGGKLRNERSLPEKLCRVFHEPLKPYGPYRIIDTGPTKCRKLRGSAYNVDEAEILVRWITQLCTEYPDLGFLNSIGIITFYQEQVHTIEGIIKNRLGDRALQSIQVATVDAFQGSEKEIILLSCVRSSDSANIGFLAIENRVNVAVTRAKASLIIFGDITTLLNSTSEAWVKLIGNAALRDFKCCASIISDWDSLDCSAALLALQTPPQPARVGYVTQLHEKPPPVQPFPGHDIYKTRSGYQVVSRKNKEKGPALSTSQMHTATECKFPYLPRVSRSRNNLLYFEYANLKDRIFFEDLDMKLLETSCEESSILLHGISTAADSISKSGEKAKIALQDVLRSYDLVDVVQLDGEPERLLVQAVDAAFAQFYRVKAVYDQELLNFCKETDKFCEILLLEQFCASTAVKASTLARQIASWTNCGYEKHDELCKLLLESVENKKAFCSKLLSEIDKDTPVSNLEEIRNHLTKAKKIAWNAQSVAVADEIAAMDEKGAASVNHIKGSVNYHERVDVNIDQVLDSIRQATCGKRKRSFSEISDGTELTSVKKVMRLAELKHPAAFTVDALKVRAQRHAERVESDHDELPFVPLIFDE